MARQLGESACGRAVITVCGGSGVGKSEIASLISYYLNAEGVGAYTLSGDNYPRRYRNRMTPSVAVCFMTAG